MPSWRSPRASRRRALPCMLLLAAAQASASLAQAPVAPHARVRIVYAQRDGTSLPAARRAAVGRLVEADAERVTVGREPSRAVIWGYVTRGPMGAVTAGARNGRLAIPRTDVLEVWASAGVSHRRGFLRGTLVGAVAGGALAALGAHRCHGVELICGVGGRGEVLALVGTIALLGGLPGALLAPERWRPATLPAP